MNLKKKVLFVSLIVVAVAELFFAIDCLADLTLLTGTYFRWAKQFYDNYKPFTYAVWILPVLLSLWMIKISAGDSEDGGLFLAAAVFLIVFGFVVFLPLIMPVVAIVVPMYAYLTFLFDKRKIRLLKDDKPYDLIYLCKEGFVRAHATGQSITQIYGEIKNLLNKKIMVVIEPGTYFVAKGHYQNMVTREEYSLTLGPNDLHSVSINAACINADRPVPGEKDRFDGVKKVSSELTRFLMASRGCNTMTVQAGVWAITDNYSGSEVINRLFAQDLFGNRRQAVSEADVAEARKILKELGIENRL